MSVPQRRSVATGTIRIYPGSGRDIHTTGGGEAKGPRPPMKEHPMAHKKVERKKELDRQRHRRAERLKQRIKEAKAAKKA